MTATMVGPHPDQPATAAAALREVWRGIEDRNWPLLGGLLAPKLEVEFPHSGQVIHGAEAFVRFNDEYPGDWRVETVRVHAISAETAVAEVSVLLDGTRLHAACFATVRNGKVVHLREYWTEPVALSRRG